jgi:hypothetical protein
MPTSTRAIATPDANAASNPSPASIQRFMIVSSQKGLF